MIDAPWSRAAPVKLWTRCNKLSRDFAGLAGALVPRAGPLPKLNDRSGAFPVWAEITNIIFVSRMKIEMNFLLRRQWNENKPRVGAGGGGIFGGPPLAFGNGCCWSGGGARAVPVGSFGSTSSHSEDKSPELNLKTSSYFVNHLVRVHPIINISKTESEG